MRRCGRPIVFLLFAFLLYCGAIVFAGLSATPRAADLAVVLGNEVLKNGEPSARLQARLDCAVSLYRRHLAPRILVSGGRGESGFDEATVMREYLIREGIPARAIFTDSLGVNTAATAMNTARLAMEKHFSRILIVSQYYHLPRCALAFRRAGLTGLSADYPRYFEVYDLFSILREGIALPDYFIKMSDIARNDKSDAVYSVSLRAISLILRAATRQPCAQYSA